MWASFQAVSGLTLFLASHVDASLLRGADERDLQGVEYPTYRYTAYNMLDGTTRNAATALGYNEESWNVPGTNAIEAMWWGGLTPAQQTGADTVGFTGAQAEDVWDCYQNHYNGYDWAELVQFSLHHHLVLLGWTEPAWTGLALAPATDNADWADLTPQQQQAAENICYFQETWDQTNMMTWVDDVDYPDYRYTEWSLLDITTKQAAQTALGYNESTWNLPGTGVVEETRWVGLSQVEKDGAKAVGFVDPDVWDCYQNHYNGYDWAELQQLGYDHYFATLGYTEQVWLGAAPEPTTNDLDWSELSDLQREAAEELCYFQETWDQVNLVSWATTAATDSPPLGSVGPPAGTTVGIGLVVGTP